MLHRTTAWGNRCAAHRMPSGIALLPGVLWQYYRLRFVVWQPPTAGGVVALRTFHRARSSQQRCRTFHADARVCIFLAGGTLESPSPSFREGSRHTTATSTVTLPAHVVSPLIRDNALASKVGSPCPKFPRSASCGCDSGRIRVPVQGLGSNACSLRGKAAIWDACHVDSRHPVGVPVVTDKRHHATPLHFKLHCTAASAGGGWSRRATKQL
jgi:hypothetical protein